jgi:hypothetical protein
MTRHPSVTFDHFTASLTEFIDQTVIDRYLSETLALYSAGYPVEKVAAAIEELSRNYDNQ